MTNENETLDQDLDHIGEQEEQEEQEAEETEETENQEEATETSDDTQDEEVTISIGDEQPEESDNKPNAPEWVRELRKANREKDRRIKELEAQIHKPVQKPTLGPKPTLEACDYDAEKFDEELDSWYKKKQSFDIEQEKIKQEQERADKEWQDKLTAYNKSKASLKVKDFDEAEENVLENLSVTQQGIIIQGADNPHYVIYVLGKNPKKAAEFAKIQDPVRFAVEIGKLEKDIKMVKKTTQTPQPERVITNSGRPSSNATLAKLQEQAEKTGDYTKVLEYRRQLKESKK